MNSIYEMFQSIILDKMSVVIADQNSLYTQHLAKLLHVIVVQ